MPVFIVNTNVTAIPADFCQLATKTLAQTLSKPESYIAVQVNSSQNLIFGGTDVAAAICDLSSIGALSRESNKKHSQALMALLESKLGVPPSRCYISFHNMDKANIGFNSTTFDALM